MNENDSFFMVTQTSEKEPGRIIFQVSLPYFGMNSLFLFLFNFFVFISLGNFTLS